MRLKLLFLACLSWVCAFPAATRDHPWFGGTDKSGVAVVRSNESGSVFDRVSGVSTRLVDTPEDGNGGGAAGRLPPL